MSPTKTFTPSFVDYLSDSSIDLRPGLLLGVQPNAEGKGYSMNRNLKTLFLVLVTMALMAVMASAAQAQFTSDKAHTVYHGEQETVHQYTAGTGIGSMNCTTGTFAGTGSGTSAATSRIVPTYNGCKDSLGRTVDVTKNTLIGTATSGAGKGIMHLHGEIILTATTAFGHCTITVKAQTGVSGISYTNLGGSKGVRVTINISNATSTIAGGAFACGTSSTHSTTSTYTGSTIIKGNGGTAAISVD
jgi:hypothetical protein